MDEVKVGQVRLDHSERLECLVNEVLKTGKDYVCWVRPAGVYDGVLEMMRLGDVLTRFPKVVK